MVTQLRLLNCECYEGKGKIVLLERKAWLEQEGSGEHGAQQRQRVVAVSVGPWSPGGGPGSQLSAGGQRRRVFAPAVAPRPPVLFSCADA